MRSDVCCHGNQVHALPGRVMWNGSNLTEILLKINWHGIIVPPCILCKVEVVFVYLFHIYFCFISFYQTTVIADVMFVSVECFSFVCSVFCGNVCISLSCYKCCLQPMKPSQVRAVQSAVLEPVPCSHSAQDV